jgi:outer membrane protein insertion porin family
LSYDYQLIQADTLDISSEFAQTQTRLAILGPVFSYRRTNNFLRPTKGFELEISPRVAAKFLGGETSYVEPLVSTSVYHPVFHRLFVAGHVMAAYIRPFGGVSRKPGYIDGVPRFERFFLGGDTIGPRIFESRTITPVRVVAAVDQFGNPILDSLGNPILVPAYVGGNKQLLLQFELGAPIGKTATLAGFFDAGGVYDDGERITTREMRMSAGLEFRIFVPAFQAPIRLIYGWPIRQQPGDRTSRFQFSVGLPF